MRRRRRFSGDLKAKVALEAFRADLDAVEGVRDFLNMTKEKPKKQAPPSVPLSARPEGRHLGLHAG